MCGNRGSGIERCVGDEVLIALCAAELFLYKSSGFLVAFVVGLCTQESVSTVQ